jgi:hypothetical protein
MMSTDPSEGEDEENDEADTGDEVGACITTPEVLEDTLQLPGNFAVEVPQVAQP